MLPPDVHSLLMPTLLAVRLLAAASVLSRSEGKHVYENEVILKHVLKDYERLSRPAESTDKVRVSVTAGLLSIDGLVEQNEQFSFTAWVLFVWRDQRLAWTRHHPPASAAGSDDSATPAGTGASERGGTGCGSSSEATPGRRPDEARSAKAPPCGCEDAAVEEVLASTNITSMRIAPSLMWMPKVFVTNSVSGFEDLQSSLFQGKRFLGNH